MAKKAYDQADKGHAEISVVRMLRLWKGICDMNEKRLTMLNKFSKDYDFKLIKKVNGAVDLKVTAHNGQTLRRYAHKDRPRDYRRICFYDKETQKTWDYGLEELMAYELGIDMLGRKATKDFKHDILIPALKEYFNGPPRISETGR